MSQSAAPMRFSSLSSSRAPNAAPITRHGILTAAAKTRLSKHVGTLCAIATALLLLPILVHGISKGEFLLNTDEPVHAVGGLFFADVARDLPLTAPAQYAYQWYAQYPALGLLHWPPLFYAVEALFFLALGPSAVAARLAVIAFALFGLVYWFRLVALLTNTVTAVCATILFACAPGVLLFEQSVMLEIPALSLCIAASYYWICYLRAVPSRAADLYRFALFAALALLTKQHSAYLAVFCFLSLITERRLSLLFTRPMLVAAGLVLVAAGPFYVVALHLHGTTIGADVMQGTVQTNPLLFYPESLPRQLGHPLFLLSIAGILTARWWTSSDRTRLMLAWAVACYVTFTFLAQKDARYIIYWLPAFVFFAVGPLTQLRASTVVRGIALSGLVGVLGYQVWWAIRYQRPYLSGYEPAARLVTAKQNPGFVVFDGDLHGNFIFYFRVDDPQRRGVVMRKTLYVTRVMAEYGSQELVHARADIESMLAQYGVRYVVVDNSEMRFASQRILRDVLAEPPFVLAGTFPIDSNLPRFHGRTLFVYEDPSPPAPTVTQLHLPMLTLPYDIDVPVPAPRIE